MFLVPRVIATRPVRAISRMPYFCNWRELLASVGYLTLSPNYRGSQGRGHDFATCAGAGIGVYDWDDCESMVHEAVKRGWADEGRLGVAGWSHGVYFYNKFPFLSGKEDLTV